MSIQQTHSLWKDCLAELQTLFPSEAFNTWISPLQVEERSQKVLLLAPNDFVLQNVKQKFLNEIQRVYTKLRGQSVEFVLQVGTIDYHEETKATPSFREQSILSQLNPNFTFETFVEGNSNQLARAAAMQISKNLDSTYNPLLMYGGVGLGKTHLLHAIGNAIYQKNKQAKVLYLHSEQFVSELVKALRMNTIDQFKHRYRSVDCLLIDDIQFFSGKDRSQEEFFHTFNKLLEGQKLVILTCDRYPKAIPGVEERLTSRLGWGLTVAIEPPDLETRVAILINKASETNLAVPQEVAFFVANKIHSNVRELEGVLKRIAAYSQFMGRPITLDLVEEAIRDILAIQDKLVTIENIIKTVAEFYGKESKELLDKTRKAKVAQARQVAMALTKEMTNHSYTEIAKAFGGRDHTMVLYAVKKVNQKRLIDSKLDKTFTYLFRVLSGN